MRSSTLALLGLLCAACGSGGGGSTPSTPSSPTPTPTIPVSSACTAVGQAASGSSGLDIVNGVECSTATSPVVLLNMKDSTGLQLGSCSGTVIAPRAILTAAHCLSAATASIKVFVGSGPELPAQSFAAHPSWREANSTAFDAAVVLMPDNIGRAPAPLLLSRDARVGENAILAGWGKDQALISATLRGGVATITAVSSLVLQTTFTANFSSVCQGDSGGPLLLSEGGVWAVAGVISANSTLGCSFGDNFYANIRNPDISAFVLGRVPDAARK